MLFVAEMHINHIVKYSGGCVMLSGCFFVTRDSVTCVDKKTNEQNYIQNNHRKLVRGDKRLEAEVHI